MVCITYSIFNTLTFDTSHDPTTNHPFNLTVFNCVRPSRGLRVCPIFPVAVLQRGQPVSCCERGNRQRAHPAQKCWLRVYQSAFSARVSATGHDCRNALVCSFNHSSLPGFKWTRTSYSYSVGHTAAVNISLPHASLLCMCLSIFSIISFFVLSNTIHHKGLDTFP